MAGSLEGTSQRWLHWDTGTTGPLSPSSHRTLSFPRGLSRWPLQEGSQTSYRAVQNSQGANARAARPADGSRGDQALHPFRCTLLVRELQAHPGFKGRAPHKIMNTGRWVGITGDPSCGLVAALSSSRTGAVTSSVLLHSRLWLSNVPLLLALW